MTKKLTRDEANRIYEDIRAIREADFWDYVEALAEVFTKHGWLCQKEHDQAVKEERQAERELILSLIEKEYKEGSDIEELVKNLKSGATIIELPEGIKEEK